MVVVCELDRVLCSSRCLCFFCSPMGFFFFFLKIRFIEINKTIYRIVEMTDIRNTDSQNEIKEKRTWQSLD